MYSYFKFHIVMFFASLSKLFQCIAPRYEKASGPLIVFSNGNLRSVSDERKYHSLSSEYFVTQFSHEDWGKRIQRLICQRGSLFSYTITDSRPAKILKKGSISIVWATRYDSSRSVLNFCKKLIFESAAQKRATVTQLGLDNPSVHFVEHIRWKIFLRIIYKFKGSMSPGGGLIFFCTGKCL